MDSVAQSYGNALFSLAKDNNLEELFYTQLNSLKEIFNEDMIKYFANIEFSKEQQKETLNTCLKGFNQLIVNFTLLLIDNKRLAYINNIVNEYNNLYYQDKDIILGKIYSARLLAKDDIAKIEDGLSKLLKKKCYTDNQIDTNLIGGFKVEIQGKIYDYSLKTQLNQLKDQLKKGGISNE